MTAKKMSEQPLPSELEFCGRTSLNYPGERGTKTQQLLKPEPFQGQATEDHKVIHIYIRVTPGACQVRGYTGVTRPKIALA